jgi:hypothetical protein
MLRADVPAIDRFQRINIGRPISPWARDRFIIRGGSPRSLILVPVAPTDSSSEERRNDWLVGFEFGRALPSAFMTRQIALRFDGGDFFTTDGWLYCDANLLAKNVPALYPDRAALITALANFTGFPVDRIELIGDAEADVPNHHIGMYLSAIPGGPLLVADPSLDPAVGQITGRALTTRGIGVAAASDDLAARCGFVAEWLASRGHTVARVPIVATADSKTFLTYTNVLVEERVIDGKREVHVYLPTFAIPELDALGAAAWRSAGAIVHEVDVSKIFMHRGALRCLTLPLVRE